MVDLGNGFTKIASLGGNGQEILCLEEKHEENSILRTYVLKKFMKWPKQISSQSGELVTPPMPA